MIRLDKVEETAQDACRSVAAASGNRSMGAECLSGFVAVPPPEEEPVQGGRNRPQYSDKPRAGHGEHPGRIVMAF